MKKFLLIALSISITSLGASEILITKDSLSTNIVEDKSSNIGEQAVIAIQTEDYVYIEGLLQSGTISPRMIVNGKPLIIMLLFTIRQK